VTGPVLAGAEHPDPEPSETGKLVLVHVRRPPLPWRDVELTECGHPLGGLPWITRDAFIAKVRREGEQRSQLTTCITCWGTAARHPAWEQDPVAAMMRETQRVRWARSFDGKQPGLVSFREELLAIAALIAAHPEEFTELLSGLASAPRLDDARAARRAAARRKPGAR
jgi:hypothetical protein